MSQFIGRREPDFVRRSTPSWADTPRDECWEGQAKGLRFSQTGKALEVGVAISGFFRKAWIPLAAIHDDSEVYEPGHEGELVIPLSLAEEKGFC